MTDTQVQEGNKLIAEFMGYSFNAYPDLKHHNITKPNEGDWYFATWIKEDMDNHLSEELKYHTSWDWLMTVVEKISGTYEATQLMAYGLNQLRITAKIETVWQAVIDFIKLYNQTNSK